MNFTKWQLIITVICSSEAITIKWMGNNLTISGKSYSVHLLHALKVNAMNLSHLLISYYFFKHIYFSRPPNLTYAGGHLQAPRSPPPQIPYVANIHELLWKENSIPFDLEKSAIYFDRETFQIDQSILIFLNFCAPILIYRNFCKPFQDESNQQNFLFCWKYCALISLPSTYNYHNFIARSIIYKSAYEIGWLVIV